MSKLPAATNRGHGVAALRLGLLKLATASFAVLCAIAPVLDAVDVAHAADFNRAKVRAACERLECREPNTIVAKYFAEMAAVAGKACVVHIFNQRSTDAHWEYWGDYIAPLEGQLTKRRARLYAFADTKSRETATAQLRELVKLYGQYGLNSARIKTFLSSRAAVVLPPYREPYCEGRPVLELTEGARIVSIEALSVAEKVKQNKRVVRSVLVVIDP